MRRLRVAVALALALVAGLGAACGPPPSGPPTTTTTTTTTEPVELPESPRMLTAPVGAEGQGVVAELRGTGVIDGYYVSTPTSARQLDPLGDLADRTLLLETFGQVDPGTGRWVRPAGQFGPLLLCDSVADDAACGAVPGTDGFSSAKFSPDGTKLAAIRLDHEAELTTLRLIDLASFDAITEVSSFALTQGVTGVAWRPDSSAVAFVLDKGVATLQAASGASAQIIAPYLEVDITDIREAAVLAGWTSQDRIISIWSRADYSSWPPTATMFVGSVSADGSDLRDLGPISPLGLGAVAPDGSLVWPEAQQVSDGPNVATGSTPVAFADSAVASKQSLSRPWSGITDDGFRASELWVHGFVDLP